MVLPAFEVIDPPRETPVVVEVPHAGVHLDPESLAWTAAPARSVGRDADLYVDAIFADAAEEGASLLVARMSRFVVDLNRGEDDVDCEAVEGGGTTPWARGLIWRLTTDGEPVLWRRLPRREFTRRLDAVYRPYHARLAEMLARKRAQFGFAILLCAHSMPSVARRGHSDAVTPRADIVPGTRGRTTAAGVVIDAVDQHCRQRGLSVRHDDPYRGGFSTAHYGRPEQGVHAVQIEIARRLYMDEQSLGLDPRGFPAVRELGRTLVARLTSPELHERLRQLGSTL
ncbi:N-formylglutamate deformylase [Chondromyces apiculatus DSM 436]|uniref:N-formylglutamate deformylase n=1 Tax=Chondromyces apiculatus DSM 436 TaxID=1192034 RepID=A0A017T8H5_9BACT|nr:N-formylglutamate deformylase [Chondromyces apiculatus DSM 436]